MLRKPNVFDSVLFVANSAAVIPDILVYHENNLRAAVIACAGMLDPPIAVTPSEVGEEYPAVFMRQPSTPWVSQG